MCLITGLIFRQRTSSNTYEHNSSLDKQSNQQNTNLSSMKSESFNQSSITASETFVST